MSTLERQLGGDAPADHLNLTADAALPAFLVGFTVDDHGPELFRVGAVHDPEYGPAVTAAVGVHIDGSEGT